MSELLPRPMVLEEFAGLVGQDLLLDCEPQSIKLRLVEAALLRPNPAASRPPFVLVFRSPPEALLIDGAYTMRSDSFGPAVIFISSMAPPPGAEAGYYYQANFN